MKLWHILETSSSWYLPAILRVRACFSSLVNFIIQCLPHQLFWLLRFIPIKLIRDRESWETKSLMSTQNSLECKDRTKPAWANDVNWNLTAKPHISGRVCSTLTQSSLQNRKRKSLFMTSILFFLSVQLKGVSPKSFQFASTWQTEFNWALNAASTIISIECHDVQPDVLSFTRCFRALRASGSFRQ